MRISFSKYQGAGNDFILIEDIGGRFPINNHNLIQKLCDRRLGIGADGLMLLRGSDKKDFTMLYYNADGFEGTMCGNGGRCLVVFAKDCGHIKKDNNIIFDAVDGEHRANIIGTGMVSLKIKDVKEIKKTGKGYCVDTGSIHHVEYVDKLVDMDVYRRGRTIRARKMYAPAGCNVNFIHIEDDGSISIRTYERGVENETLACGTGAVAAAIVHHSLGNKQGQYPLRSRGGTLAVRFEYKGGIYQEIWLEGPATFVYKGVWEE
ncbi:MAG: diaminopimelate epimerase [Candidatus Marinimicrobia bacterium]|nr:diaminopimelate epimerase [Candidatus Neomarinimicrobiota bacterium]